jgi:hypothetical protein
MKLAAFFLAGALFAQETTTRQLWTTFQQQRPAKPAGAAGTKAPEPRYRPTSASAQSATPLSPDDLVLGVTLWRMREPRNPGERLLVLPARKKGDRDLVPERVSIESPVAAGERVRITLEIPRSGYLYIIDQEKYADGTLGDPYLIYPNWQVRPGENLVGPGRTMEIPDRREDPNYFEVVPSRTNQVAEVLSVLIAPQPLPGLTIGEQPLKLTPKQFGDWQKYKSEPQKFELQSAQGQAWTQAEMAAGAGGKLSQSDAMPQHLYRCPGHAGEPLLVNLPIQIQRK